SAEIYRSYTIYYQSGGAEQAVFDGATGRPSSRSDRLVLRLRERVELPHSGRLLDVGCGNGAFLAAFGRRSPGWALRGLEVNDNNRAAVEQIPGVEALDVGELHDVPGDFDLISLIHALEHIADPAGLLQEAGSKLVRGGAFLIEVPN